MVVTVVVFIAEEELEVDAIVVVMVTGVVVAESFWGRLVGDSEVLADMDRT